MSDKEIPDELWFTGEQLARSFAMAVVLTSMDVGSPMLPIYIPRVAYGLADVVRGQYSMNHILSQDSSSLLPTMQYYCTGHALIKEWNLPMGVVLNRTLEVLRWGGV